MIGTKSKRGGARPGAGRKPDGEVARDATITARVTPAQRAAFDSLGGADWLRAALDQAIKYRHW